ncbi:hypothetical protein SERLADRAFT_374549 [Serpula lacrymans var. lacrymans S7.9]|nr:uncharacterized protein SERLADRAFT_374549 [Serpula lacrymans var. lacrymans S7.9]EGO19295.1 hypothetical protein SERLADRAFT_374549 [Serpula lacrymans var. lacrymans S7.9]
MSDWEGDHDNSHPLVRCQERIEEAAKTDPSELRILELENKIASLDDRFTRLEKRMDDQELAMNERFVSLEQLLIRVVSKLSA